MSALRAVLYEYGQVAPQGIGHLKRIEEIIAEPSSDLPKLVREECRDLIDQIADQIADQTARIEARIETRTARLRKLATEGCKP